MMRMKWVAVPLLVALGGSASASDFADITPYRPSVSDPAQLPAVGQLELELGGLSVGSGDLRRNSLPYLFKLAFDPQWGVLIGGEAAVSASDESGQHRQGLGDTTFVLKYALPIDDATALGLETGATLPTANDAFGIVKTNLTVNGILSRDFGQLHIDANLNLTRVGLIENGDGRTQIAYSASFSLPVGDKWGVTAELSGTRREGVPDTAQFLAALTYSPSKLLTIDCGFARGLNSASPGSIFTGMVMPIAKLW